jgi:Uracil-DNA glycosylase
MFMIGEQPGDYEDVAGKPFVGPAGKILIARWRKLELIGTKFI